MGSERGSIDIARENKDLLLVVDGSSRKGLDRESTGHKALPLYTIEGNKAEFSLEVSGGSTSSVRHSLGLSSAGISEDVEERKTSLHVLLVGLSIDVTKEREGLRGDKLEHIKSGNRAGVNHLRLIKVAEQNNRGNGGANRFSKLGGLGDGELVVVALSVSGSDELIVSRARKSREESNCTESSLLELGEACLVLNDDESGLSLLLHEGNNRRDITAFVIVSGLARVAENFDARVATDTELATDVLGILSSAIDFGKGSNILESSGSLLPLWSELLAVPTPRSIELDQRDRMISNKGIKIVLVQDMHIARKNSSHK
jgi:hypothetical protein